MSILDNKTKHEIASRFANGETKASLARQYGVSPRTIGRAIDWSKANPTIIAEGVSDKDKLKQIANVSDKPKVEPEPVTHSEEYTFIMTQDSIAITHEFNGEIESHNIDHTHEKFDWAFDLIMSSRGSQESLAEVVKTISKKVLLEQQTFGRVRIDPKRGKAFYLDEDGNEYREFSGRLVERLVNAVLNNNEDELTGLVAFSHRVIDNPSFRAVNELYDFLQANDIKINEDGMVICFKKVREDYLDIYSGTFDNSPGQTVEVPRNMVDEDSEQTCSYGLHVCSKSYLSYFGSSSYSGYSSDRVVKVQVDPKDFVAIPRDYNNSKARVCCYTVLEDVTEQYKNGEL